MSVNPRVGRYNRLSDDARRAVGFDNLYVWAVARQIEYPSCEQGGRPNTYPLWVFFLWMVLIHEYGSSRKVEEAFEDQTHGPWNQIRTVAEREFGNDRPDLIPPIVPPTRNQFNYALKHHLGDHTDKITETVRTRSRQLAVALKLGTPDAAGSLSCPGIERVAFGDVTVMTARSRTLPKHATTIDRATGEIISHRHDPDIGMHTTGGGAVVPGLPYAFTHLRGARRNQQVILAVDPVTPAGPSEGHLVVDQYLQAAQHLPGLVGYAYDRALRGVHLDRLLKAGHIGLVGVHKTRGKPADRYHGPETHHPQNRPARQVDIHLVGGAPHIRTFDVDGNQHLRPLRRRKINKRVNKKDGSVRLSAEYDVTGDDGTVDGYVRIRLDQTTGDKLTGYNRPEHLRAFPETDQLFGTVQHQLRASAESANRVIDDHHPRERLHHYGFEKNTLSMLAWQAYRNDQTEHVFATPQAVDLIRLQQTA
jgi:hypothetical protein